MMDDLDTRVLELLSGNGRMPITTVSQELGISLATATRRVSGLERNGVIKRYAAVVDPEAVGLGVTMFIHIAPSPLTMTSEIPARLSAIAEIEACYATAGTDEFLVLARASTLAAAKIVRERVERAAGSSTRITVVLSETVTAPGLRNQDGPGQAPVDGIAVQRSSTVRHPAEPDRVSEAPAQAM